MKKKIVLIFMLVLTIQGIVNANGSSGTNGYFTDHFLVAFTGNGINHMNINILEATIGGITLDSGDEIAAFDGSICVGVVRLIAPFDISSIAASQATDGLPNGYTSGHAISFKFWDVSNGKEISLVTIKNSDGLPYSPVYTERGSAFVRLSVNAALTVGIDADDKVYDGTTLATVPDESVVVNGLASGHVVNVIISNARFDTKNVGNDKIVTADVSITGTDAGYYSVNPTVTTTAKIIEKGITITATPGQSKLYGAADPVFSYTFSPELVSGDSFTGALSRVPGETVGTYSFTLGTLSAGSNYSLTISATPTFTIASAILSITVTATPDQSKVYGADDPALAYSFSPALEPGDSFTGSLSRVPGENIGDYAITQGTLSAGSDYNITFVPANFTIVARSVTVSATPGQSKVYGTADPEFAYTFSPALEPGDSFTGALLRVTGEIVGNYSITQGTLSAGSNYDITFVPADFTISARLVTVTATPGQSKVYGAADPEFAYTVSPALEPGDSFTGALSREPGENIGNYEITQGTLSAGSNYDMTFIPANFIIASRSISVIATPGQSKVYGMADPEFAYTVTPALEPGESFTGALSRLPGENIGNYAITQGTLSAGTAYAITFETANFAIAPSPITVTATPGQSKVYGTADTEFAYTVSPALETGDSFSGTLSREPGETVGNYPITQGTLSAGTNYDITFEPADFTIVPRSITVTATPGQSKVYGAADPEFAYTVSPALETGDSFTGSLSREPGEIIGSYPITQGTLSAGPNYTITFVPANFTIASKAVTVTATPGQSKFYGTADPEFVYTISPALEPGDSFSGTLSRMPGESVGNYAITLGTLSAGAKYSITYVSSNFTIAAKLITVTATPDLSKVYGTADPVFAYTVSPALVSGDSFIGLLSRLPGENVGNYAITQGTLSAGSDYAITFVPANFGITAKPITVTATSTSKTYNSKTASAGIPAISPALVAGDTPAFIQTFNDKMAGENKTVIPSGQVIDGNGGKNYNITFVNVNTGIINPLVIVGSFTAGNKVYDGNTGAMILTRNLTGVIIGDVASYSGGTANFDTPDAGVNKTVSATGLVLIGADAPNYSVNATAATLANINAVITSTSVTTGSEAVQYSDEVVLTATITGGALSVGDFQAAKSVTFTISGQIMKDSSGNTKIIFVRSGTNLAAILVVPLTETSLAGSMAPGNKTVTATFNDLDSNFSLTPNQAVTTFTIAPEDAITSYSGDYLVSALSGGTATVALRANISDNSAEPGGDAFAGDIRNATVSFVNRSTGAILGTGAVTLPDESDLKTGTALFNWTGVSPGDYIIDILVNNYYTCAGTAENAVVVVHEATGDYLTGGGYVSVLQTLASGQFASGIGQRINFGFDIRFDNKGVVSHGYATIILPTTINGVPALYQIQSTNITAVAVNIDNPNELTGGFIGVASLSDITDPLLAVELADGLILNVNMADRGKPGTSDDLKIKLWRGTILLYSTDTTEVMNLAGGDLIVHSSFNLENSLVTGSGGVTPELGSNVNFLAYPNPSPGKINFRIRMDVSSTFSLDILSMDGRLVSRIFDGYIDRSMDKTIIYESKLPQGIYYCRLKTSKQVMYSKIVIARMY